MIVLSLGNKELAGTIPRQWENCRGSKDWIFVPISYKDSSRQTCNLESLFGLLLGGDALEGRIPTCLANLTSLISLNLRSIRLNSTQSSVGRTIHIDLGIGIYIYRFVIFSDDKSFINTKYGSEGIDSTSGNVCSFVILMAETILEKSSQMKCLWEK